MGSFLEAFEKLPVWQRVLIFALGLTVIVTVWFLVFYRDALARHDSAKSALKKAQVELHDVDEKKKNFIERQRKQAEIEAVLKEKMDVLPMSIASVDHLMQTFQQQARLVGLTVESWVPGTEALEDYYSRLPVKVQASGTWAQAGEFFRRISELDRIVSVDNVQLQKSTTSARAGADTTEAPLLTIQFEAATYRFLGEAERASAKSSSGGQRRREGKKK